MILPIRPTRREPAPSPCPDFPQCLVDNGQLKDADVRLVLLLERIGWHEGPRDGLIRLTHHEIADRLGKHVSGVRRSLSRISAASPSLVTKDGKRGLIRLLFGATDGAEPTFEPVVEPAPKRRSAQKCTLETQKCEPSSQICTLPAQICTLADPEARKFAHFEADQDTPPPISSFVLPVVVDDAGAGESTRRPEIPAVPKTVAQLLAWLPTATRDKELLERFRLKIPLWMVQLQDNRPDFSGVFVDWVRDAIIAASEKQDPVSYAAWKIGQYAANGGRQGIELPGPGPETRPQRPVQASATNQPPPGQTEAVVASRRALEAEHVARKRRWDSLADRERKPIEAEFDRLNPKPADQPPKFWAATRLLGCMALMDSTMTPLFPGSPPDVEDG